MLRSLTGTSSADKVEARRIRRAIDRKAVRSLVVYDNSVSPPTYGDFLNVVMVARFLAIHGMKVDFRIVSSDSRFDWSAMDESARASLVADQVKLATMVLGAEHSVEATSWAEVERVLGCHEPGRLTLWGSKVRQRNSTYNFAFNLLNRLLAEASSEEREQWWLSAAELAAYATVTVPDSPYCAWHCRYSDRWGAERNLSEREFIEGYANLHAKRPDLDILVLSDSMGCAHFREIAERHDLSCLFSADFSSDFFGDMVLALRSHFYFQIKGGGMVVVAMCSSVPYEIRCVIANEKPWSETKLASWQTSNQRFEIISKSSSSQTT